MITSYSRQAPCRRRHMSDPSQRPTTDEITVALTEMLPTPSTSHVPFERIYEPAEDSYLLLDTLSSPSEVAFLRHRFRQYPESTNDAGGDRRSPLVVEVGTGSGVVLAFLTAHAGAIFGREDVLTLGTDVNCYACQASQKTVAQAVDGFMSTNNAAPPVKSVPGPAKYLDSLLTDLCAPLRSGVTDVLVFNPPYVPTSSLPSLPEIDAKTAVSSIASSAGSSKDDSHLLALSYAGGINGMETTDRLLAELDYLLDQQRGVAYVLLCAQNKPEEVKHRIQLSGFGWVVETVGRSGKAAGWEKLEVLRIWRQEREIVAS